MPSETVFEYRHKKFDQAKRSREDDSLSSENSILLDLSDSSKTSISPTAISNPRKQRKVVKRTTSSNFFETTDNELRQRLQRVNINQHKNPFPFSSTENNRSSNGTILAASDNRVVIKTEIIEPKSEFAISPPISESKLTKTHSTPPIKIESSQTSPNFKIKKELIELNVHLPAIPREAYEDICKFRSNMVRKFPKKERSVKEQERRDKNTYACRKSRRVKKIEQVAVEEEYKNFKNANLRMAEYAIRAGVYFKELMKMTAENTDSEVIVVD